MGGRLDFLLYFVFAFLIGTIYPMPLNGQNGCYHKIRQDGIRLMEQKKYGEAITQFWTALTTCTDKPASNDLSKLIQQAQNNWVEELEGSIKRENQALVAEHNARLVAESAEQRAKKLQTLAEQKEEEAYREARRAEALRLSMLSNTLREKGSKSDALIIAFWGRCLAGDSIAGFSLKKAFSEAVRDSLSDTLFTSASQIRNLYLLPKEKNILVQLIDGALFLINPEDHTSIQLVKANPIPVDVAVSSKGNKFLTWSSDGSAILWNGEGTILTKLIGHKEAILTAAFSDDEDLILTGSRDNTARLWKTDGTNFALTILEGHAGNIYQTYIEPGNKWLFTRSSDGSAASWNMNGTQIAKFGTDGVYVHQGAFMEDGSIAIGTAKGKIEIANIDGLQSSEINTFSANVDPNPVRQIWTVGNNIISLNSGNYAELWERLGENIQRNNAIGPISGLVPDFKRQSLICWDGNSNIQILNFEGRLLHSFSIAGKKISNVCYHSTKDYLLVTMADGTVYLTELSGNIYAAWPGDATDISPVLPLFSQDSISILLSSENKLSLLKSPLPELVFENMLQKRNLNSDAFEMLRKKYDIKFKL